MQYLRADDLHINHLTSTYSLVFTAGNADTFSRVLLTLKMLRNHYNTSLPAEIFSFPGEMPPPDLLDEFGKYNATLRVVRPGLDDATYNKLLERVLSILSFVLDRARQQRRV